MYYYITINTASTILILLRYVFFLQSYMCIQLSFVIFNLMKMIKKNELLFNVAKVIKFLAYFKITISK